MYNIWRVLRVVIVVVVLLIVVALIIRWARVMILVWMSLVAVGLDGLRNRILLRLVRRTLRIRLVLLVWTVVVRFVTVFVKWQPWLRMIILSVVVWLVVLVLLGYIRSSVLVNLS